MATTNMKICRGRKGQGCGLSKPATEFYFSRPLVCKNCINSQRVNPCSHADHINTDKETMELRKEVSELTLRIVDLDTTILTLKNNHQPKDIKIRELTETVGQKDIKIRELEYELIDRMKNNLPEETKSDELIKRLIEILNKRDNTIHELLGRIKILMEDLND